MFCSTCISFNPSFKKPLLKQAFFQCIGCHILASHCGATSVQSDMLPSFGVFYQVLIGDFPKSQLGIFPSPSWGFSQVPVGGFPKSQLGVFPMVDWIFSQWWIGFFPNNSNTNQKMTQPLSTFATKFGGSLSVSTIALTPLR